MNQAERIARLELEVNRLTKVVEGLRLAAGKDAIPVGMCHKGHDLKKGPCPKQGPYMYQRGCRGANGENGCSLANSRYYQEHPRGGKAVPVKVRAVKKAVNNVKPAKKVASTTKKAPAKKKGSIFGRS